MSNDSETPKDVPVKIPLPKPQAIITDYRPNLLLRRRIGIALSLFGLFLFVLGADPGLFGLDRSPVVGFIQIAVFLIGLGAISIGGYTSLVSLWGRRGLTIAADIGMRLISTGYVIAAVSGMADVFGFGSEAFPKVPTFGIWQSIGVLFGEFVIGLGFLLLIPWSSTHNKTIDDAES